MSLVQVPSTYEEFVGRFVSLVCLATLISVGFHHVQRFATGGRLSQLTVLFSVGLIAMCTLFTLMTTTACVLYLTDIREKNDSDWCKVQSPAIVAVYGLAKLLGALFFTFRLENTFHESFLRPTVVQMTAFRLTLILFFLAQTSLSAYHQTELSSSRGGCQVHLSWNYQLSLLFGFASLFGNMTLLAMFSRSLLTTAELLGDLNDLESGLVLGSEKNVGVLRALRKHTVLLATACLSSLVACLLAYVLGFVIVWLCIDLLVACATVALTFSANRHWFDFLCEKLAKRVHFFCMKTATCHRSPEWLSDLNRRASMSEIEHRNLVQQLAAAAAAERTAARVRGETLTGQSPQHPNVNLSIEFELAQKRNAGSSVELLSGSPSEKAQAATGIMPDFKIEMDEEEQLDVPMPMTLPLDVEEEAKDETPGLPESEAWSPRHLRTVSWVGHRLSIGMGTATVNGSVFDFTVLTDMDHTDDVPQLLATPVVKPRTAEVGMPDTRSI